MSVPFSSTLPCTPTPPCWSHRQDYEPPSHNSPFTYTTSSRSSATNPMMGAFGAAHESFADNASVSSSLAGDDTSSTHSTDTASQGTTTNPQQQHNKGLLRHMADSELLQHMKFSQSEASERLGVR
eukprot:CAMPEP_0117450026 /NCGR_PEP_ID=MMETSP0759-20121206/8252_1 /TAXON_ID=63605 /ORGANISM="Percolomonas cosmopolitus, Strain WS" /LENGTH=125 /DNA_ID=CAMNT_0005242527 /DNA_START=27 /DNA_END=404 /DNA_ORIENTATION=-